VSGHHPQKKMDQVKGRQGKKKKKKQAMLMKHLKP
jgi:hypothetical protein